MAKTEKQEEQADQENQANRPVRLLLHENTLTAVISGEIDHHSACEIREIIDMTAMRVRPEELVLDFGAVHFMDSSGVGLILGRCKMMEIWHGHVTIQNMPQKLERIVSLAGLHELCEFRKVDVKHESAE
ncbi:MAG TPA: anti-anti-sigma factor [Ruminococcaceae bacterium]|jgi:stage II sporulation protein AA (anti-sigma F factor antagonist)|nr:anti-sigma factor antagonist [Oscillospiraceae bacterium]HCA71992.1 anti-anti-sigma factor [Oscillospiraceae bacterium]HCC02452.1 anti-anti-sigma factor [Oscillospiraceae bacterium]